MIGYLLLGGAGQLVIAIWSFIIVFILAIVAVVALAEFGAGDSRLEALTVVLIALCPTTVTALKVSNAAV